MRHIVAKRALASWLGSAAATLVGSGLSAQSVHEAPAAAPSRGAVAPKGEPGQPLHVSGVGLVGPDGSPVGGASLYVYQTDQEGYYGVKPGERQPQSTSQIFWRFPCPGPSGVRHREAGLVSEQPRSSPHPFEVAAKGRGSQSLRSSSKEILS